MPDAPDQCLVGVSLPDPLRAQEFLTAAGGRRVCLELSEQQILGDDLDGLVGQADDGAGADVVAQVEQIAIAADVERSAGMRPARLIPATCRRSSW